MAHPMRTGPMSVEEFFDFEARTTTRHEYVDGEVFAMSGATRRHNAIAGNIYIRLRTAARGGPCRVHFAEVKLRAQRVIYYPDVLVACGPAPDDERIEDAPCVVVEVLSPSTESTDCREKLMVYKSIPSLHTYLIVDQLQRRVDRYWRAPDDEWRHDAPIDDGSIPIDCGGTDMSLTLDEIYEGVTLPSPEERLRLREEEAAYR